MSNAWIFLILFVGFALSISFLCSILEATLLSTRIAELIVRKEREDRGAAILLDFKRNRIDDAISAILTLNTIVHTIGPAMAGALAGTIKKDEPRLFDKVLRLEKNRVEDVMTPRTVAVMLPFDRPISSLLESKEVDTYSRIPLFQNKPDKVVGNILL